jgi:hypothetical protein
MPSKRVIMRLEVVPGTPEALARVVDEFGSTNVSVVSRLLLWLMNQSDVTQACVLGLYPGGAPPDILKIILEQMKVEAGKKDHKNGAKR